jgi:hypothetical protein
VFENRLLRRIFGPKRDELTKEWGRLHNDELHDLYCSPNILRKIKSRIMRSAGHVAGEACKGFWWGNLRERYHWGDPDLDGRITLRWISKKWDVGAWTEFSWLRKETGVGHL